MLRTLNAQACSLIGLENHQQPSSVPYQDVQGGEKVHANLCGLHAPIDTLYQWFQKMRPQKPNLT